MFSFLISLLYFLYCTFALVLVHHVHCVMSKKKIVILGGVSKDAGIIVIPLGAQRAGLKSLTRIISADQQRAQLTCRKVRLLVCRHHLHEQSIDSETTVKQRPLEVFAREIDVSKNRLRHNVGGKAAAANKMGVEAAMNNCSACGCAIYKGMKSGLRFSASLCWIRRKIRSGTPLSG